MGPAAERIAATIRRHGPIPFDRYMELALYEPAVGFYATAGQAGRQGDFITSAEVGPLFGAVVARALDAWHVELGEPDPFVVVEAGAGPGSLARSILAAAPACAPALRYVLVERSAAQRRQHENLLAVEPSHGAFARRSDPEVATAAIGPMVLSLAELPGEPTVGVVLANELLDNLSFAVVQRAPEGWEELHVGWDGERFTEVLLPAPIGYRDTAEALAPDAPIGGRVPVAVGAWEWLRRALSLVERGRVVAFDYAAPTAELARRPGWLRGYRGHERSTDPLAEPGAWDITADVPLDQLARVAAPATVEAQASFLARFGLDELVEEGRRIWAERAHLADLAALTARSRVREAEALTDPAGLGAFSVMTWVV